MKPGTLDALIHGRKVYINRRPDESVYATIEDFYDFGIKPLKIMRVPLDYADPVNHPDVVKAVKALDHCDWQDANWS